MIGDIIDVVGGVTELIDHSRLLWKFIKFLGRCVKNVILFPIYVVHRIWSYLASSNSPKAQPGLPMKVIK